MILPRIGRYLAGVGAAFVALIAAVFFIRRGARRQGRRDEVDRRRAHESEQRRSLEDAAREAPVNRSELTEALKRGEF